MTRQDTIQVLAILKKAYPVFYRGITKQEAEETVDLWHAMFEDDDLLLVINAIKAFIATDDKGYPPVIGVIKKKIREISQPDVMSEMEAWGYVKRAVRNALYNAKVEYDKLPPTIKRVIGSHNTLREWAVIDTERFDTVVQSNFMRSYKAIAAKEQDYIALPQSVKDFSRQFAIEANRDRLIE